MPTRKTPATKELNIPAIQTGLITFGIKGTSPLVTHAWSEKSLDMLRMSAAERRKTKKEPRNPAEAAESAAYKTASGEYGVPAHIFRLAAIEAAHKDLGIEKILVRKSFFVLGDDDGMIALEFEQQEEGPIIREDIVRVGANQTDIRYRPEFRKWRCIIRAVVDFGVLQEKDILALMNRAGFGVGICENRPEKNGEWGRFVVDSTVPVTTELVDEAILRGA